MNIAKKFLEIKKPWQSVKENKEEKSEAATTLFIAAEVLRIASCFLYPVMPSKAGDIIQALDKGPNEKYNFKTSFGMLKPNRKITDISNIFPRID